jgi:non-canonical poly(A) RNA polymerase PAPD5/7
MSDDDEADMVESDDDARPDTEADGENGAQRAARIQEVNRADGDSVPKWSNPDPYTVLPPPEEVTGKRIDFVKLIRKAKVEDAEKAAGHNSVAANDDFISFGDEEEDGEVAQGSMNDVAHSADIASRQPAHVTDHQVQRPSHNNNKRKATLGGVVQEWEPVPNINPTPWLETAAPYAHLARDPDKW